jgi:UV DNA damage repair endonuclease
MTQKIGFACKWIDHPGQVDGVKPNDDARKYNTGTTTVAWLNRQSRSVAEDKLWSLVKQNTEATRRLVERVGEQHENLRMVRLSSDILPVFTEPTWRHFYDQPDVRDFCSTVFASIGAHARSRGVRLSFHPGQFCVLASDRTEVVESSIEEFEYHATMTRWMGYGKEFQDFKINVHIAGKKGPEGFRLVYNRLSPEARNCITLENEEISYGLNDCLSLADLVPTVLDIHHHWIREGEYIMPDDVRIQRVIDSWRGVRPVIHFSVSREDILPGHSADHMPLLSSLLESGHKKQKLRAHSDFYWNNAVNDWALQHQSWADIMCESKAKNLASRKLYERSISKRAP